MTTFTYDVLLDDVWTDAILVTAFDASFGACNYWLAEGDVENLGDLKDLTITDDDSVPSKWEMVTLEFEEGVRQLRVSHLADSIARILNHPTLRLTATAEQLRRASATPNDAPDLDAEACDVIIQVALFGEIVYG